MTAAGHHRSADVAAPHLTRRGLLRAAFAGAGIAALAGCSTPVGAGLANTRLDPGTVDYWNLFGGGDGVRMQQMLDGYRKANPGIDARRPSRSAWGNPYYTKLSLATVGGKPPERGGVPPDPDEDARPGRTCCRSSTRTT